MLTGINPTDFQDQQQSEQDKQLLVKFFVKPIQDRVASEEQGRPVYRDVEYVDIKVPGQRDGICRPVRPRDIARFQQHYDLYKARTSTEDVTEGTLLTEWPAISRSMAEELAFFNIKTVEQLANMSDSNAGQFMGGQNIKRKAQEWLEIADEANKAAQLKSELAKRDKEIDELKAAVAALQAPKKKVSRKKASRKKVSAKKE